MKVSGEALAYFRNKAGLTQEQLAEKIGTTRVTVNGWEMRSEVSFKDEDKKKALLGALKVNEKDLTMYLHDEKKGSDILDHPVIKSLVAQSEYIMGRVRELEEENRRLRGATK